MELYSGDVERIKKLLEPWAIAPDTKPVEVEATFGSSGQVDIQTFLRVISYLTEVRRLQCIEQQDYLTIGTDNDVRFTIMGAGEVQLYCREDRIIDMEGVLVQQKNKTGALPVDIDEYSVRVKSATEVDLDGTQSVVQDILSSWAQRRKYFRLIKRWTFKDTARGVKFDLSMVRSSKPKARTKPITSFQDQDLMSHQPTYEIEAELDRGHFTDPATRKEEGWKALYLSIGDILKAIQGSPILIRKSLREEVLREYAGLNGHTMETIQFVGVSPVTLRKDHITDPPVQGVPNIRKVMQKSAGSETESVTYYNVTDKADGLRCLGFVRENGELFLIDMNFNVYRTGLVNPAVKNSLVDGEYITRDRAKRPIYQYAIFDYYIGVGKNKKIRSAPFYKVGADGKSLPDTRYEGLVEWITNFKGSLTVNFKSKVQVGLKSFHFASDKPSIFKCAQTVLDSEASRDYYQDGLIFTPNESGIPEKKTWFAQFKWKPAQDNTIDFLIKIEKDKYDPSEDLIETVDRSGTPVQAKLLKLFVGSDAPENPRELYLSGEDLKKAFRSKMYRGVPFSPLDPPDVDANKCFVELQTQPSETGISTQYIVTEESLEPLTDNMIVEMKYDLKRPVGWRWVPTRVRQDKTEKFRKALAKRSGNFEKTFNTATVANDIWSSIHDPITRGMITNEQLMPTLEERTELLELQARRDLQGREYYNRRKEMTKDVKKTEGMRDFHKKKIKNDILFGAIRKAGELKGERPRLIDLACGLGGDYVRYLYAKAGFVLGVDLSPNNINNPQIGAYHRLVEDLEKGTRRDIIPPIFYVVGDSSVDSLRNGQAGFAEEDKAILKTVFGLKESAGQVPLRVLNEATDQLRDGADACCLMYALHYFFGEEVKLEGVLRNVRDTLKVGGLFVGTNFDGGQVYSKLRGKDLGHVEVGQDESERIWEITKQYERDEPSIPEEFGLKIEVQFASISPEAMAEYLVPWDLQVKLFERYGLKLLSKEECSKLGLSASSELYGDTMKGLKKLDMNEATRSYSQLHRWWVFKRVALEEVAKETAVVAEEANGVAAEEVEPGSFTAAVKAEEKPVAPAVGALKIDDIFQIQDDGKEEPIGSKAVLGDLFQAYPGRFLSPSAEFPYKDGEETYPTFWNYWAGLHFKTLEDPTLQKKRFDFQDKGKLWQDVLAKRTAGKVNAPGLRKLMIANKLGVQKILEAELKKVPLDTRPDSSWALQNRELLKAGLRQRMLGDKKFKDMVCRIGKAPKLLLFNDTNEILGAGLTKAIKLKGQNLYGGLLMEIAKEPGMCT